MGTLRTKGRGGNPESYSSFLAVSNPLRPMGSKRGELGEGPDLTFKHKLFPIV